MDLPDEYSLKWRSHDKVLCTLLETLLTSGKYVDVTLAVEGHFVNVHRLVLIACSPYFEGLLNQLPGKKAAIFLKDVSYTNLKALVEFMYKGVVNLSQDQLPDFIQTAKSLQIKGLFSTEDAVQEDVATHCNTSSYSMHKKQTTSATTGELHPGAANHNPLIEFHYQEESSSAALESEIEVNQENLIAVVKQENSLDETTNLNQIETASENWVIDDGQQQEMHIGNLDDLPPRLANDDINNPSDIIITNTITLADADTGPGYLLPDISADTSIGAIKTEKFTSPQIFNRKTKGKKRRHLALMSDDDRLPCPKCDRSYLTKKSLYRHLKFECCLPPMFKCPNCDHRVHQRSNLKLHMAKCRKLTV